MKDEKENRRTRQELQSLSSVESYWAKILEDGELPSEFDSQGKKRSRRRGVKHVLSESEFSRQLKKLLPPGYPKSKRVWSELTRIPVWVFPPLDTCRDFWDRLMAGGPSGPGPRG